MKLSRPQHQEPAKTAEAPAVDRGVVQTAASASMDRPVALEAQAPSVRGSATMMSVASGATAVPDYDQPTVELGIEAPVATAPSIAYVGNESVWVYGDAARVYHVTERETAAEIQRVGFLGGWGDCGYGLYVYTSPGEALAYAKRGGWDKSLKDPVVLVAHIPLKLLQPPELHPDWNPKSYECVLWAPMDENSEDVTLLPEVLIGWDALAGDPAPELFPATN